MASYKGDWAGRQNDEQYYAYQAFKKYFGREPSDAELAIATQSYVGGDRNIPNVAGGDAAVAQMAMDEQNLPVNQRKKFQEQAGERRGDVDSIMQDLFKRGASDAEVQHFGALLASGEVDPYELRAFVMETPEYRTQQDTAFREKVGGELADLDTKAFGRQKEDVISRFSKAGRLGSTALDFALTDLMGQIAEKRQGFLSTLSADLYRGNKESARADYGTMLSQMGADRDRSYGLQDAYRTRGWNVNDYNRQSQDYMRALSSQRGGTPWWSLGAGALGAGLGSFGGPMGAAAGWQIGTGLGSGIDYSTRY